MVHSLKHSPLEAFCVACPDPQMVTAFLRTFGFSLAFQMEAIQAEEAAPLPAQYHYQDNYGTEVIYLAGKDTSDDETIHYPHHASRLWAYSGSNQEAYSRVVQALASRWFLLWLSSRVVARQHVA